MCTNTAIKMTVNQSNDFLNNITDFLGREDVKKFIDKEIIKKLYVQNIHTTVDRRDVYNSISIICLENNCQSEGDFWWLLRQKENLEKVIEENKPDENIICVDFNAPEYNGSCESTNTKNATTGNNEQVETAKETHQNNANAKKETKSEIIDGDIITIQMINWLNNVDIKTDEWQEVKEWIINALNMANQETRKQAITYSKMTKAQRVVWILSEYYYFINGGKVNQTKVALFVYKVRGLSDSQLVYKKRKKSQKSIESYARQSYKAIMCRAALSAGIDISTIKGFESEAKKVKRANVISMADFIKQHKQLDFNFNRQKSKIGVKNKVVNGCSSGDKENAFSASPNAPKAITKTIYADSVNKNINQNLADVNSKKTSKQSKILQFNAFVDKSINPKAIGNNNTLRQVIPLPLPKLLPDKAQQRYSQPFDRQYCKIIRKTKRRSNMLARDGP